MDRDDLLRVLSRYAPAERWTPSGDGYRHSSWMVCVFGESLDVYRYMPDCALLHINGDVGDLDAMMARAEWMAQADAMRVGDGNE